MAESKDIRLMNYAYDPIAPKISLAESHPLPDSWDMTRYSIYRATKNKTITFMESMLDHWTRSKYRVD